MSEIVTLISPTNPKTTCQIETVGCGLGEVWLNGQQVLWTGTRPDGGKGFTHPCLPNFNLADGLPNHGPARKSEWSRIDEWSWTWQMSAIDQIYPAGLAATRKFELSTDTIKVTTTITNHGKVALPVNVAEHNYFCCPPELREKVTIDGVKFSQSGLNAEAEFNAWSEGEHLIFLPQLGTLNLTVSGYHAFAQWSQPNAPFVCIEPIQTLPPEAKSFLTSAPTLKPNETKIFSYKLSLV